MCGIVGIYYRDEARAVRTHDLQAMCDLIRHRGPDDHGVFVDGNVGMGMRRLAIIDLDGGVQPMSSPDGRITVVFNGEIYNHADLRAELRSEGFSFRTRSDTEVLVHGYRAWGNELPERLNGMFAFSIWDSHRRRLLIARDRVGIKPLYIVENDEFVIWSSEIKAFRALSDVQFRMDERVLLDYLRYGYVPGPHTLLRGVQKFPPATLRTFGQAQDVCRQYWTVSLESHTMAGEDLFEELRFLVDDSVQRRLMSDVPLGAFLSGGIDSSAIVATMRRVGTNQISTYSIGFGEDDRFHDETDKAERVAATFGTRHHKILAEPRIADMMAPLAWYLDEPLSDTSFIVTYLVSKLASDSVKVILSGVGGDELFGGYRRYLGCRFHRIYDYLPKSIHRGLIRPVVDMLPVDRGSRVKSLFRYARGFLEAAGLPEGLRYDRYVAVLAEPPNGLLAPDLQQLYRNDASVHVARLYDDAPTNDSLKRMAYADLHTSLVDSLLLFTDKMSMAVSLEARVPLLDHRLVELGLRIPDHMRIRGIRGLKWAFRQAMRDRLGTDVINQRKQGFGTPISRWFRTELKTLLYDLLSAETLHRRGYFRWEGVRKLLDDHMAQRADNSEALMTLLMLELWQRSFLDSTQPAPLSSGRGMA